MQFGDPNKKVVSLTNYLVELPASAASTFGLLLLSIVVGALGFLLVDRSAERLAQGATAGLLLFWLPAFAAAVLVTLASKCMKKELALHRSLYLSFFTAMMVSVMFLVGSAFSAGRFALDLYVYGLVLVFMTRVFVLFITYPYTLVQTVLLSSIHSLLGFAALFFTAVFPTQLPAMTPAGLLFKTLPPLLVLAAGVVLFIVVINAPMKRNFGVKTFELAGVFIAHWYDQSSAIEKLFKKMGEKATTLVGVIAFRLNKTKAGLSASGSEAAGLGSLKSLFVIPYVHPGPFGEIGGANLSKILTSELEKTGATVLIPHGTATHDLDPLSSESIFKISNAVSSALKKIDYSPRASFSARAESNGAQVFGQAFGKNVFVTSTFAPEGTEDIDFAVGLSVMKSLEKNHEVVVYADSHNCHRKGNYVFSGNPRMFYLLDAMQKLDDTIQKKKEYPVRQGIAVDSLSEFSLADGIGPAGLRASVIQVGAQKTAYVLFDANNMVPGLREKIITALSRLGVDEVEVMTTDSHCVNSVRGVENPLGKNISETTLVSRAVQAVKKAIEDLEPVSVGMRTVRVEGIDVLGPQKSAQLVSTVNSMIAMMKILAPAIFISVLMFSLFAMLVVPW